MASLIVAAVGGAALYNIFSNAFKPSTSQTINNINKIITDSIMSSIQQSQDTSSFSQQLNATCDADVIMNAQHSYNQCVARFVQSVPSGITLKITTPEDAKDKVVETNNGAKPDGEYELWTYDGENTIKPAKNTYFSVNNIWINKAKNFFIYWDENLTVAPNGRWVLSGGDGTKYNKQCKPPDIINNNKTWSTSVIDYCGNFDGGSKKLCERNKITPTCDDGWKGGNDEKKNSNIDQHDDGWVTLDGANYCPITSCYHAQTDKCKLPTDSAAICDSDYSQGNNELYQFLFDAPGANDGWSYAHGNLVCPKTSCHQNNECKPKQIDGCQDKKRPVFKRGLNSPVSCDMIGELGLCDNTRSSILPSKVCPVTCGVCTKIPNIFKLCEQGVDEASCTNIGEKLCTDKNKECPKDASYCEWVSVSSCAKSKDRHCQYGNSITSGYSKILLGDNINNRPRPGLNSGFIVEYEPSIVSARPNISIDDVNGACSVFGDICYVKNVSLKLAVNVDNIKRQQADITSKTATKLANDLKQYDTNSGTNQIIDLINTETQVSVVKIVSKIHKNRVFSQALNLTNVSANIMSMKSTGNIVENELLTNTTLQDNITSISNMIAQTSLNTNNLYKNTLLIITFLLTASTIVSVIMTLHRSKDLADFLHTMTPYFIFTGVAVVILVVHILAKPAYVTYSDDKGIKQLDKDKLIKYLTVYYSVIGLIIFAVFKFYI